MHAKIQSVPTMQKSQKALLLAQNVKLHVCLTRSARAAEATVIAQCLAFSHKLNATGVEIAYRH